MPISRETTSNAALSGGNNLATALSLNACPYRATEILHRRPLIVEFYRHDNYSDAAGFVGSCPTNNAPHTLFIRIFGFVARSSRVNGNGDTPSAF